MARETQSPRYDITTPTVFYGYQDMAAAIMREHAYHSQHAYYEVSASAISPETVHAIRHSQDPMHRWILFTDYDSATTETQDAIQEFMIQNDHAPSAVAAASSGLVPRDRQYPESFSIYEVNAGAICTPVRTPAPQVRACS